MKVAKEGDKVQILCEARLEDGRLCYSTKKDQPLELIIGDGKFFPAIENALKDMKEGTTKKINLEPRDAFGQHNDDLVIDAPKDSFHSNDKLDVGSRVKIAMSSGKTLRGFITDIKEETLTIDFNHPLAGMNIIFTLTLLSIL